MKKGHGITKQGTHAKIQNKEAIFYSLILEYFIVTSYIMGLGHKVSQPQNDKLRPLPSLHIQILTKHANMPIKTHLFKTIQINKYFECMLAALVTLVSK